MGDAFRASTRSPSLKVFPWSHTILSNLKGWLRGTYHGVSPKYMPRNQDEFTYRYSHRYREHELAHLVPGRLLRHEPTPFHRLEAEMTAECQASLRLCAASGPNHPATLKRRDSGSSRAVGRTDDITASGLAVRSMSAQVFNPMFHGGLHATFTLAFLSGGRFFVATSILLADAQKLFRDAIKALIETRDGLVVVGEASDGVSTVELVGQLRPDVIVMEIALPRLSGTDVIQRVAQSGCASRFLILSSQMRISALQQALAVGASGFVSKSDPSDQLLNAINAIAAGRRYVSPAAADFLVDLVVSEQHEGTPDAPRLTSRERQILQLVAEGLSSKEIATSLGLSKRTVESHRSNLMEKLGIHKVSGLVRYAIREGLLNP